MININFYKIENIGCELIVRRLSLIESFLDKQFHSERFVMKIVFEGSLNDNFVVTTIVNYRATILVAN